MQKFCCVFAIVLLAQSCKKNSLPHDQNQQTALLQGLESTLQVEEGKLPEAPVTEAQASIDTPAPTPFEEPSEPTETIVPTPTTTSPVAEDLPLCKPKCFCNLKPSPKKGEYMCVLNGGVFPIAEKNPVTTQTECANFCRENAKDAADCKSDVKCRGDLIGFSVSGDIPIEQQNEMQIKACIDAGISMPPKPFTEGWKKLGLVENLTILPPRGQLWRWSDEKTVCIGIQRLLKTNIPSGQNGIICFAADKDRACQTCFFDGPGTAPDLNGTGGDELKAYMHIATINYSAAEVCSNCHIESSSPLIVSSPELTALLETDRARCKSYKPVGFEMMPPFSKVMLSEKDKQLLKPCAECHSYFNKDTFVSAGRCQIWLASIKNYPKSYMPPKGGSNDPKNPMSAAVQRIQEICKNFGSQ